MNEAELSWVTDHLGHSADVHKLWYRQEESTVELTKVAKVLMAKDNGERFHNKTMAELCGSSSATKSSKQKVCNLKLIYFLAEENPN